MVFFLQLVIGDFGLNHEQSKAQFGLWSILAAVSVTFLKIERKI